MTIPTRGASTSRSSNWCSTSVSVAGAAAPARCAQPPTLSTARAPRCPCLHLLAVELGLAQRRRRRARAASAAVAPEPGHVQHAASGGHDLAIQLGRARVEDLDLERVDRSQPADLVAGSTRTPGSRARPAPRSPPRSRRPLELDALEAAGAAGALQQLEQVGAQPRQHGLRLGVAEAGSCTRAPAARRRSSSAPRRARRGRACRAGAARRRSAGAPSRAISSACSASDARHGRVAAHAAGVRPARRRRDRACSPGPGAIGTAVAVAQRQQRQLLALEELLEHHLGRRRSAGPAKKLVERRARLGLVGGDDHALPAASTSAFSTAG